MLTDKDPASCRRIDGRNFQRDQPAQHWIENTINLGDASPLGGIAQIFQGQLIHVAARDLNGFHLEPGRDVDRGPAHQGLGLIEAG